MRKSWLLKVAVVCSLIVVSICPGAGPAGALGPGTVPSPREPGIEAPVEPVRLPPPPPSARGNSPAQILVGEEPVAWPQPPSKPASSRFRPKIKDRAEEEADGVKARSSLNEKPWAGPVSPSNGSCAVDTWQTFSNVWVDNDGSNDLDWCFFLIAPNPYNAADIVFLYYRPADNTLWLVNDEGTGWIGPATPDTATYLENSKVRVDCQNTWADWYTYTIEAFWRVMFKKCYVGTQKLYTYCKDQAGLTDGPTSSGTWTITGTANHAPQVGPLTPNSGGAPAGQLTYFYPSWYDADPCYGLDWCMFLIGPSTSSAANRAFLYYDALDGTIWLCNDAGTGWLGGYNPGAEQVISNSQVTVFCKFCDVHWGCFQTDFTWAIAFKSRMQGNQNLYLYARDDCGATSGWVKMGTWSVSAPQAPQVGTVTPSSGGSSVGEEVYFTTTWSDPGGWTDLDWPFFLVAPNANSAADIVFLYFDPVTWHLWLVNDAGTGWIGPGSMADGDILSNNNVTVYCGDSTASAGGNTLSVTWALSFKMAYTGHKNLYLYAKDREGLSTGSVSKGYWFITWL